jgi:hypothetical protein
MEWKLTTSPNTVDGNCLLFTEIVQCAKSSIRFSLHTLYMYKKYAVW